MIPSLIGVSPVAVSGSAFFVVTAGGLTVLPLFVLDDSVVGLVISTVPPAGSVPGGVAPVACVVPLPVGVLLVVPFPVTFVVSLVCRLCRACGTSML